MWKLRFFPIFLVCLMICRSLGAQASQIAEPESQTQQQIEIDLSSIPISDWLQQTNISEIPWNFRSTVPGLRMDQRLEISYGARISAKNLNRTGHSHELFMISQIVRPDQDWASELNILPFKLDGELPSGQEVRFGMRILVKPGDYELSVVLYDRITGKHNALKRRIEVPSLRNDPLPDAFTGIPPAEFPRVKDDEENTDRLFQTTGNLFLPVGNTRPIDLELISTFSPPDQWARRARMVGIHKDNIQGALAALSQVDLRNGSISVTGLDLARREVLLDHKDIDTLDWTGVIEGFEKAGSSLISTTALQGRKANGTFFRDFLDERLSTNAPGDHPLRVLILITGSILFESGSDLQAIQLEGDCRCRVYHLRFRLTQDDVFDDLQKVIRPLRPRTFNLLTPRDLRKAIGAILDDLQAL
jgi:hypothetical protein